MLGITNHWCSLLAHKINGKTEFFYFDSRNRNYLTIKEGDIKEYVKNWNKYRIEKEGKDPWYPYLFGVFE